MIGAHVQYEVTESPYTRQDRKDCGLEQLRETLRKAIETEITDADKP